MYRLRDYLVLMFAICLFLPSVQAEDNLYRIDGIPDNLHYETGKSYQIDISVDSLNVSYIVVTMSNGTLSETEDFGESNLELNLTDGSEGWLFHWQAPTESFDLGEGNAELTIVFNYFYHFIIRGIRVPFFKIFYIIIISSPKAINTLVFISNDSYTWFITCDKIDYFI